MSEVEKKKITLRVGEPIKCPNCGAILPEETISPLLRENEKDFAFLLIGVVMGAAIGVVGNFWVSFAIETLRGIIPETQWLLVSVLGLIVTTLLTVYVLIKMIHFAEKRMDVGSKREKS